MMGIMIADASLRKGESGIVEGGVEGEGRKVEDKGKY